MKSQKINFSVFVVAVCAYSIHTSHYMMLGRWENLLWACHLGVLLIGIGFVLHSSCMIGIGFFWGTLGACLWIIDLASGGEFIKTSLLTHIGAPLLGFYGIKRFGMHKGTWWKAAIAFFSLQQICRWFTPSRDNVNAAHFVWSGWEDSFASYFWYMVMLYFIITTLCWGIEFIIFKSHSRFIKQDHML